MPLTRLASEGAGATPFAGVDALDGGDSAGGAATDPGSEVAGAALDELVIGTVDDLLAGRTLDQDTSVVLVTRNVDVDAAALPALLSTDAGYVGVMGSERRWSTTTRPLGGRGRGPRGPRPCPPRRSASRSAPRPPRRSR